MVRFSLSGRVAATLVCLATVLASPAAVLADGGGSERPRSLVDTLFWAPEILVEGFRTAPDDEVLDTSGFVGLLLVDPEKGVMADAATLLSRATGVDIRQYGGLGSYATMSIRGSSSMQVQFYLDGVPLNDSYSGVADLSEIPLGGVHRVEIYRGFSPVGFGNSSIGGTVNLVSAGAARRGDDRGPLELRGGLSSGSFGATRYSLGGNAGAGGVSLYLHGGITRSSGDFDFRDDNATPFDPSDDAVSTRSNNDFIRTVLSGRVSVDLPRFEEVSLSHSSFRKKGGVPGTGADQSSGARLERSRRMTYLRMKPAPLLSRRLHLSSTAFYNRTSERFDDREGDIGLLPSLSDNRIASRGVNLRMRLLPGSLPLSPEMFVEHRRESFDPTDLLPERKQGPERKRASTSLSGSADLLLFGERLIVTASHRSEFYETEFYDEAPFPWIPPTPLGKRSGRMHAPAAGLRYRFGHGLTLKGNIGLYYRMPTFFELFGDLGTVTGDSDLLPESGKNSDIGLLFTAGSAGPLTDLFLEATFLYNEVEDLILFFPNSQSTVQPRNIGRARIMGVELSFAGRLPSGLSLSGSYCWLDSEDIGPLPYYNGKSLPGRPRHKFSLDISLDRPGWALSYRGDLIGSNYLDRYNTRQVPSRRLHGASITVRPLGEGLSFTLQAENIGDERTSDVSGFPLPGRTFYASMAFEL